MNPHAGDAGAPAERPGGAPWARVAAFAAGCTATGVLVGAAVVLEAVRGGGAEEAVVMVAAVLAVAVAAVAAGLVAAPVASARLGRAWVGIGVAVGVVFGGVAIGVLVLSAAAIPAELSGQQGRVEVLDGPSLAEVCEARE